MVAYFDGGCKKWDSNEIMLQLISVINDFFRRIFVESSSLS